MKKVFREIKWRVQPTEEQKDEALKAYAKAKGQFSPSRAHLLEMFKFYYSHVAHAVKDLEKEINCGYCRQRVMYFFNTKTKEND